MSSVVFNLFAGQGTGRTDEQTKRRLSASPFEEHNNSIIFLFKLAIFKNRLTGFKHILFLGTNGR